MTKQQQREQRRKAKKLARVLNELPAGRFIYNNSLSVPGDGVMAVEISIDWNGKWYTASGAAKCNRVDPWSEGLGVDIATGRALLRIAYQILKEEDQPIQSSIQEEIIEAIKSEYGNVTGIIFVKPELDGPRIMFETAKTTPEPSQVPGSAKYRGDDNMQYGWGVVKPEVVPTGLEVMKEKGMLDDKEDEQPIPSSTES